MLDLTKLFSNSRDLGFVTDLRGSVLGATPGAERALGYPQAELVGLDLCGLDEAGELKRFLDATPVRSRMNLGFHLRTRSGEVLTIGALATSLRDDQGEPVGWFIAGQDLRGAVGESRGSHPILDALMDSIGASLWSFDRNGTVITWGRACEAAFGLSRGEAEGKLSVVRLFPSPDEYRRVVEAVDRTGQFSGEMALLGPGGAARLSQLSVTPLVSAGLSLGYTCVSVDIAERKRVEELQRAYFEQVGEAIVVVDLDSVRVVDINDQACRIYGYEREEFLGLAVAALRPTETAATTEEVTRILEKKGSYESDREVGRRKDGSRFPCALNIRRISVGRKAYTVAVVRDLTAQRNAEEFQRVLFEQAGEAIVVVDLGTRRILDANARACELHGYPRDEFLRLRIDDIVATDPQTQAQVPVVARTLAEQGRYEGRRVHRRKDGSQFPCSLNLKTVTIGGRMLVIGVHRDLTEQLKADEFHRVLFEQAGEAIVVVDHASRRVLDANDKAAEMHGYSRKEFLGLEVEHYVAGVAREEILEIARALQEKGRYEGRQFHRRKDGSVFPCSLNLKTLAIGDRMLTIGVHRDLTEELKAEEFFRVLFEKASDPVYLVADEGLQVVAANEAACRLLGYSRDEFLRLRVVDLVPPPYRNRIPEYHESMKKGSGYRRDRRVLYRKDGSVVATDHAASRVEISGKPYYMASCRDLTEEERVARELEEAKTSLERHVAERTAQLRESEEKFRGAFAQGGIGMALVGPDGRFLQLNRSLCDMLGYGEGELCRTTFQALTHPEDQEKSAELIRRMVRGGPSSERLEKRYFHKNGRVVWADLSTTLVRDAAGAPLYFVTSIQDITERKRAEEELRLSEARFRSITEATPLPVTITRPDGEILYFNEATSRLFRLGSDGTGGRKAGDFYADPVERDVMREKLLRDGGVEGYEIRFRRPDGTLFWAVVNLKMLTFDGAAAILGSFVDIDERKRAEELLRKAHEELERRVAERTTELARANTLLQEEIAERKRAENTLRLILEGTAAVTGGSFFRSLARHLASVLDVRYAMVVQGVGRPPQRARTIAFWTGSDFSPLVEYPLRGTPCDDVAAGEACSYAHDVQRLFPECAMLGDLGVESYLGVPMVDSSGTVVGHIVLMDVRPVTDEELKLSVLKIFAARGGVELERQLAEEALRESEERWRSLVTHAPDMIMRVDRSGKILSINRTLPNLRMEDVVGKTIYDFASPEADTLARNALQRVFEERVSVSYEVAGMGPHGTTSWYSSRISPIIIDGEVVGATIIAADETERKKSEMALRESEERWRALVENAPDFILTVDRSGCIQSINRTVPGIRKEDTLGKHVFNFVHPDAKDQVQLALDRVFNQGLSHHYETRAVGANGTMAWYDTRVGPIKIGEQVVGATFIATDISERRKADQALRESEERWKALVANAPDIITTVDQEGRIQSINRLFSAQRFEDVQGRKVYEFIPPDSVERVRTAIETVFRDGRSVSYEVLAPGANGTKAWYSSRVGPVILDGRVVAATIISTDITERWRSEQRQKVQHEVTQILAEAESVEAAVPQLLHRVCEGLDWQLGILWKADPAAKLLRFVDAWQAPGVSAGEFLETSRASVFPPGIGLPGRVWKEHLTFWVPDVQDDENFPRRPSAARSGVHAAFAAPVEGPQRTFGVIEFFSLQKRDRDEPLLRVASTLGSQLGQFIERKQAEADLRFQKSLLESQSEAAIDGILVVSREGVMTSFNRRFCQMWEISDEVLLSKTDERALQSVLEKLVDPKEFLDRVHHLYEHPNEESRDEIHLKDGRAFDRYSAPVKGADGELYGRVWYFRDVTGRKHTEENLRRAAAETRQMYENLKEAQAQLIRSEKLASIGMLVSGVAHEINNPLNVMYGNLQLLAEVSDVLLPLSVEGARSKKVRGTVARVAKFRGMIRDALKAARHAREIVQDFRNFARDTRTAELVDLNECLEEAVTLIQRELRPGIRVVRKLGRIPQVRCLRGQMSQVFLNLLKNAGEAIERKGTVTLRTQQKNGHVLVEVADTGRGMAEEVRSKLFEPFFTTKPVGKGLGLGLSISAMIVHNHSGNITVQSRPGKGSVFRVELPLLL